MADTAVAITAGSGTNIDTRTEGTNGNHRQVVVIGDPATNAGVAAVDATNGLSVNVTNASLTVGAHAVTVTGSSALPVTDNSGSLTVDNAGTFAVQVTGSSAVPVTDNSGSLTVDNGGTFAVQLTAASAITISGASAIPISTINGQSIAYGSGSATTATQRVVIASDQLGTLGIAAPASSVPVTPPGFNKQVVAASTTTATLGGSGTSGDYLNHVVIIPASTSPGAVTVFDNATTLFTFSGGASSVTTLIPFVVPVCAFSTSGAWKVTTGSNVAAVAVGKFS